MSRDFSFKENMILKNISGIMPFGIFCAKYDKNELFADETKEVIVDVKEKIELYKKLLIDYINDSEVDFSDSNCTDVAEFLIEYLTEMDLFKEPGWDELKDTLEELKNNNGTLGAQETFKFILNYSQQINILKENNCLER